MEKIIRDEIVLHMESNTLFSNQQNGFRKGKSCTTHLIEVMDDWTSKLDGNDNINIIYIDFQKAFDSVPHERLLKKLYSYGIQGHLLGWIRNFLTNREKSSFKWNLTLYCNIYKRHSARKYLGTSPINYLYK